MAKKKPGKELANYDKELAKEAQDAAANEVSGSGNNISMQNGQFVYKGGVIGDELDVIILDSAYENSYYAEAYDPDNPSTPVCFSINADVDAEATPHEKSTEPQHETCNSCWANEFGTADVGKGKACKNARRLMMITPDALEEGLDSAEVAMFRLPPASLKYMSGYVKKLQSTVKRPPYAVITKLTIESEKTYFVIKPTYVENVDNKEVPGLRKLRGSVEDEMLRPYEAQESDDIEKKGKKTKKKVANKKASGKPTKKKAKRKF